MIGQLAVRPKPYWAAKKGVLDREIEGLFQSTNKKDDKNFQASFGFLSERVTLNEIEELEIFWKNSN